MIKIRDNTTTAKLFTRIDKITKWQTMIHSGSKASLSKKWKKIFLTDFRIRFPDFKSCTKVLSINFPDFTSYIRVEILIDNFFVPD